MGSSRDWAASKGTVLLGVKAVVASSFERIHRNNLIGMGVLPLQFENNESAETLGFTGKELFSIHGFEDGISPQQKVVLEIIEGDKKRSLTLISQLQIQSEVEYYRHGGILPFVLRQKLNR